MAGLNYGNRYTYSKATKENKSLELDINTEGVVYSDKSKKYVVRVKNKTKSKHLKPFRSVAQFSNKDDAEDFFQKLTD